MGTVEEGQELAGMARRWRGAVSCISGFGSDEIDQVVIGGIDQTSFNGQLRLKPPYLHSP